jgi:serine/threonine protein phosphatase PrpC
LNNIMSSVEMHQRLFDMLITMQVDDLVLAVSRRAGTRDGATALVVLRLGGALYSAHAGDSRAVLCRDGEAHRLTEDHKPHLPQVPLAVVQSSYSQTLTHELHYLP